MPLQLPSGTQSSSLTWWRNCRCHHSLVFCLAFMMMTESGKPPSICQGWYAISFMSFVRCLPPFKHFSLPTRIPLFVDKLVSQSSTHAATVICSCERIAEKRTFIDLQCRNDGNDMKECNGMSSLWYITPLGICIRRGPRVYNDRLSLDVLSLLRERTAPSILPNGFSRKASEIAEDEGGLPENR